MKNVTIIFVLLFTGSVARGQVKAQWVETPMPHWSCPAGKLFLGDLRASVAPPCRPAPRGVMLNYDPETQEAVPFEKDITITNQGTVAIEWAKVFARIPGCSVTGDEKKHIEMLEQSKERLVISGHPGQHLHLECTGIINR